jgi:hypothetical protein
VAKTKIHPDTKRDIIEAAGLMLSIGADWATIRTELYRQTTNIKFTKWKPDDLPAQRTLQRWLLTDAEATTMSSLKQKRLNSVKTRLKRKALTMALNGDRTMLIFSLKNLCGWSDNPAVDENPSDKMTPEERKAAIKKQNDIANEEG